MTISNPSTFVDSTPIFTEFAFDYLTSGLNFDKPNSYFGTLAFGSNSSSIDLIAKSVRSETKYRYYSAAGFVNFTDPSFGGLLYLHLHTSLAE